MVILRPVGTIGNRLKYLRKIRGLTRKRGSSRARHEGGKTARS